MSVQHEFYLWFNPQDRHYYENCQTKFDGFCIAAHLAAHYGNAFAARLNDTLKSYFIDPETVSFQTFNLSEFFNERDEMRRSWEKLFDNYPSEIKDIINSRRPVLSSDFILSNGNYSDLLYELINSVTDYQRDIIENRIIDLGAFMDSRPELLFIIPPYFYFGSLTDDWYRINQEILEFYNGMYTNKPKYAILCFNKNILLNDDSVETVVSDLVKENIEGYLLWINDLNETIDQSSYLSGLLQLVSQLSNLGKKVINLYGGYFSVLSTYWGMTGHASGVNSRENRTVHVRPIGGGPQGGPIPRYYIAKFHDRVVIDVGARLVRQFNELRCDCEYCQNNPHGFDPATGRSEARQIMNRHFMNMKKEEIESVLANDYPEIFTRIGNTFNQYSMYRDVLPIDHLERWWNALSNNVNLL